jgi:putative transposase
MARPLRIEYEGAFYHVTARGNERKNVFLSKADYEKFLANLKEALPRFSVVIHGYVLMGNHYHLLVETPNANLSAFMHALQSGYTTYLNKKRNRSGHLFQGRFKSVLVEKDSYLLELSRYIHMNPVRAHLVERPEEYPYSSCRAYVDPEKKTFVSTGLILAMAGGPENYRRFVETALLQELPNPSKNVYGGMILGSKGFIKETIGRLKDAERPEVSYRRNLRSADLDDIVALLSRHFKVTKDTVLTVMPYRAYAVYLAKKFTPLSNPEIGVYFGDITFSAVTKIASRLKARMKEDPVMRKDLEKLEKMLSFVNGLLPKS